MVPIDIAFLTILSLSASLMGHSTIKADDLGFEGLEILWTMAVQQKGKLTGDNFPCHVLTICSNILVVAMIGCYFWTGTEIV